MRNFRSGTLERSVRRWGKFPSRKFQRVQHGWKYVTLSEQSLDIAAPANNPDIIVLSDSTDWGQGGGNGVKNVVLDLVIGVTWTPTLTALAFETWEFQGGIWCMDGDDDTVTLNNHFAAQRAIWWNFTARNTAEMTTGTTGAIDSSQRWFNWRVRAKQRYMKFDEELRLVIGYKSATDQVMSESRLSIFGRVSWEIP